MCEISNEIKFCTCLSGNYNDLENSWIIIRRKANMYKVGQTVFNESGLKIKETEIKSIENKLNSQNMFDFEFIPKDEDLLKIKLVYQNKCSEYYFKYLNDKWVIYNESPLDWMEDIKNSKSLYFEEFGGKIDNPFK